jgi:hypothetical protein
LTLTHSGSVESGSDSVSDLQNCADSLTIIGRGSFGLGSGLSFGFVGLGLGSLGCWGVFLVLDFGLIVSDIPSVSMIHPSEKHSHSPRIFGNFHMFHHSKFN